MKHVTEFSLFEAQSGLHPNAIEFKKALESDNFWAKTANRWFNFFYKKTGRIALSGTNGCSMPSGSYIEKIRDWRLWYVSAGQAYGETHSEDPIGILKQLVKDAIKKNAPSHFRKAEVEKIISPDSEEWLKSNVNTDRISDLYPKMREFLLKDLPIVKDFSNIRTPLMDRLYKSGVISEFTADGSGKLGISFTYRYPEDNIISGIGNTLNPSDRKLKFGMRGRCYELKFIPRGSGKKIWAEPASKFTPRKIDIGFETEEEVAREMDKTILNALKNSKLGCDSQWDIIEQLPPEFPEVVQEIFKLYVTGNPQFEKDSLDILVEYIKKNPLKTYALDPFPELKTEVLKRTGLRDLSKLGRSIDSGFF
jgi:hypothetical protein